MPKQNKTKKTEGKGREGKGGRKEGLKNMGTSREETRSMEHYQGVNQLVDNKL